MVTREVDCHFFTIYFNLLKYGTHLNDMANTRTGEGPISSKANPEPRNPTINRGVLSFCNRKEGFIYLLSFRVNCRQIQYDFSYRADFVAKTHNSTFQKITTKQNIKE